MLLYLYICVQAKLKREGRMVSLRAEKEHQNALIGIIMVIIAILFICYMVSSLVSNTHEFWLPSVQ